MKISFSDASDAQLLDYARNVLNIDVDRRSSRNSITAKIRAVAGEDADGFDVPDANILPGHEPAQRQAEARPTARSARELGSHGMNSGPMQGNPDYDHFDVTVAITHEQGGDRNIPVGVNGSMMLVPRGKMVPLAAPFLEVLRNAVRSEYHPDADGDAIEQKVPAYPITIHRGPYRPTGKVAA